MAIIDKIRKNGTDYDIQDTAAQADITDLKSALQLKTEMITATGTEEIPFDFAIGETYKVIYANGAGTVSLSARKSGAKTETIVSAMTVGDYVFFSPTTDADALYVYVSDASASKTILISSGDGVAREKDIKNSSCVPIVVINDDYTRILRNAHFENVVFSQTSWAFVPAQNRLSSNFIEVPPKSTISIDTTSLPAGYKLSYIYYFNAAVPSASSFIGAVSDGSTYTNNTVASRFVIIDIRPVLDSVKQIYPSDINGLQITVSPQDRLIGDIGVKWISGYNLNSDGSYSVSAPRSVAVIDAMAFAGGKIRGYTRLATNASICAFDSNGVLISCLLTSDGVEYNYDFSLDVPAAAKYVLITCGNTYLDQFYVECYGIANGINNAFYKAPIEYDVPSFVHGLKGNNADFPVFSATRLEEIYEWWSVLRKTFSRNLSLVKLGVTTTPEGKYAAIDPNTYDINAYVYQGDDYFQGNDFVIYAAIHGAPMQNTVEGIQTGEGIQNTVSLAYFAKDMLCNPQKSKTLMYIRKHCRILFVPVVNPWGYKNGTRCNGRGVDCNRNFDLNFVANAIEYQCSSGTAAFSENESRLLKEYIVENFSGAKFGLDLHTRGAGYLPTDTRWLAHSAKDTLTTINGINSNVADYLTKLYDGLKDVLPDTTQAPNAKSYFSWVQNIPVTLIECACAMEANVASLNGQLVQEQYTRQLGMMVQEYVDKLIINPI